ncbi:YdcF family protein, partial [Frankia sp. Cpl3]|nr:YdcF family protein [Frankia sp. Cpl3]
MTEVEKAAVPRKADVAIVLGAAVWDGGPSPGLKERLNEALLLYKQQYVPYLIVSGGLGDGKEVDEATV